MTRPYAETSSVRTRSLSEALVEHCARPIGGADLHQATRLILDWCGISLAAVKDPSAQAIRAASSISAGRGDCTALGGAPLPPEAAAFVNGSLGSLLEMDDLHRASILHAGDVVIPAALASAQISGCSGRRLTEAVVIGYELALILGRAAAQGGYTAWYNSATCGVFGAAIAAAHAAGAPEGAKLDAVGQAGMQASGLWQCRLEPTDSKAVAAAHAARAGVTSALLAVYGVRGARHILDGPLGFFSSFYPDVAVSDILDDLAADWVLHQISFKPWPACRHVHPAVGLAITLRDQVAVADIARVRVKTYAAALAFCDIPNPTTSHAARFSLQHCVAAALIHGAVRLEDAEPAALNTPAVARLRARVDVSEDPAFTAKFPNMMGARVDLMDVHGGVWTLSSDHAPGDPEDPLTDDDLMAKFRSNLHHVGVGTAASHDLLEAIHTLPDNQTLAPLTRALQAASDQIPTSSNIGKTHD